MNPVAQMVSALSLPQAPQPFLTGSRAYGTPRDNSDYDIVCLLDAERATALASVFPGRQISLTRDIRWIGPINLIVCTQREDYEQWKEVTDALIAMKPVTREAAIQAFNEAGLTGSEYETTVFTRHLQEAQHN